MHLKKISLSNKATNTLGALEWASAVMKGLDPHWSRPAPNRSHESTGSAGSGVRPHETRVLVWPADSLKWVLKSEVKITMFCW